jgi:hypothetical protein
MHFSPPLSMPWLHQESLLLQIVYRLYFYSERIPPNLRSHRTFQFGNVSPTFQGVEHNKENRQDRQTCEKYIR